MRRIHRSPAHLLLAALPAVLLPTAAITRADPPASAAPYPTPSSYSIAWELKFSHGTPQRIVVDVPGQKVPQAYWYMTYSVTNKTDREQSWLPTFEMMADDGKMIPSDDKSIPGAVFDAIKKRERLPLIEPANKAAGALRVGEGQAKDGVAIWPEPTARMGHFSIFVSGLSGEVRQFKKVDGNLVELKNGKDLADARDNLVILRKTLRINYHINGDEVYPGEDEVNQTPQEWVMR